MAQPKSEKEGLHVSDFNEATLAKAIERLEHLHDSYVALGKVPVPDSIKAAVKEKWELTQDVLQVGVVMAYLPHERKADSKRLIRFGDALEALQDLEEELVDRLVKDEADLIFKKLNSYVKAAKWLADNWNRLDLIFKAVIEFFHQTYRYFVAAIPLLIENVLIALSLPAFALMATRALKARDKFPVALRKKALPQRTVKRVFRRKIARL